MSEISNGEKKGTTGQVSEKNLPLKNSKNIEMIDGLLATSMTIDEVRKVVEEKFGEVYCTKTFKRRRTEIRKILKAVNAFNEKTKSAMATEKMALSIEFKTLEQTAIETLKYDLPPDHPQAKVLATFKDLITSFLRRSTELYAEVDLLALTRFLLNLQHMRTIKLFELEVQMGMPLRDNTENVRVMLELIKDTEELYKRLGYKPKFGHPAENLENNLGGSPQKGVTLSERQKEIQAMIAEVQALPPELREERSRKLLLERINRIGPVDAKFTEVKNDKPNLAH